MVVSKTMDDINQLSIRLTRTCLDIKHNNDLIPEIRNRVKGTELLPRLDNLFQQGYILVKEGSIYRIKRPYDL